MSESISSAAPVARVLSRPRFALLVFAAVYPLVTMLLYLMQPVTADWACGSARWCSCRSWWRR